MCLRAVNRACLAATDMRVMNIIDTIRRHTSNSAPPNIDIDVTPSELSSVLQAHITAVDWVLLACITEKRSRQADSREIYEIFQPTICDMAGKSFMYWWTSSIFGKLSLSPALPRGFKPLCIKMEFSATNTSLLKKENGVSPKERNMNKKSWIFLAATKLCHARPRHLDKKLAFDRISSLMTRALFTACDRN